MKNLFYNGAPVKHAVDIFIKSNGAETGPPLGTILGNLGVNSAKFCKDFNEFTKHLPNYFVLKVRILVFENRTFSFFVKAPSTSFILSSLKFEKSIKVKHFDRMHTKSVFCIGLNDLLKLSKFKFFSFPTDKSLFMI
jgi:ribosomal protein L11